MYVCMCMICMCVRVSAYNVFVFVGMVYMMFWECATRPHLTFPLSLSRTHTHTHTYIHTCIHTYVELVYTLSLKPSRVYEYMSIRVYEYMSI